MFPGSPSPEETQHQKIISEDSFSCAYPGPNQLPEWKALSLSIIGPAII